MTPSLILLGFFFFRDIALFNLLAPVGNGITSGGPGAEIDLAATLAAKGAEGITLVICHRMALGAFDLEGKAHEGRQEICGAGIEVSQPLQTP